MKITNKREDNHIKFADIVNGEVFLDSDKDAILKIQPIDCGNGTVYNAIWLANGEPFFMYLDDEVTRISAELVIE